MPGYTPAVRCTVDGRDITGLLEQRLVEAVLVDGTGIEDDGLTVTVDNRGDVIARPRKGARVEFSGGYLETGIRRFGTFFLEDVEKTGPNRKLTIIARAGAPGDTFKEKKYRSFVDKTVGEIIGEIAKDHKLTAAVASELASIKIPARLQIAESDMHLLTSLGMRLGAVATPKDGHLVFARKGKGMSVTGGALSAVRIGMDDLYGEDAYLLRGTSRPKYGTIRAFWHDRDKAHRRKVEDEASEGRLLVLPDVFNSEDEAKAAIDGARNNHERAEEVLTVSIHGRIEAQAEADLFVSGIDRDANGKWSIEVAEHIWSGSEIYQTIIEAIRKEPT